MRTARGEIPDRLFAGMSLAEADEYLTARRRRPSRRDVLRGGAALAGTVAATSFLRVGTAVAAPGVAPAKNVHLGYGSDPRAAMTVSWSTARPVTGAVLDVGVDDTYGLVVDPDERAAAGHPVRYHHATVEGLAPATTYTYRVRHDGLTADAMPTGTFTTAPAGPVPFRFCTVGDMGDTDAATKIARAMHREQPDLVFVVGDLCYADLLGGLVELPPGTGPLPAVQNLAEWDHWFGRIRISASGVPWMCTVGNHEMEVAQGPLGYDGFHARLTLPAGAGTSTWYSFRHGNVGFVALDANDVSYEIQRNRGYSHGAQRDWLEATLTDLRADPDVDFIVVGFHHCAYCTNAVHGSDGGVRAAWGALFDQHAVDLVINGHNHSYERTHPMRGGAPTRRAPKGGQIEPAVDGTTYVTAGAGGQAAYPVALGVASTIWTEPGVPLVEASPWSAIRDAGYHSMVTVDVEPRAGAEPARMRLSTRRSTGRLIDRLTLVAQ